ncbi:hypothetical protein [Devosia elaeis]|uniref:hypothetical protein n=1 Tax=Devosia elaeis TaxID=1770058 RepID=UPI0010425FDA|nr:hypothetical protein [Devosia elaeis]
MTLWQSLHHEGLRRVSTVVDGNANYDELLEYRLTDEDRAKYGPSASLESKQQHACTHIARHLLEKRHTVIVPRYSGFVSEGSTPNNDREYQFFEETCAPLGIRVRQQNYSETSTIGMGKRSSAEEAMLETVLEDAQAYYRSRDAISAGLVRQLTLFSVSFFRTAVAFHRKGAVLPGVLVQANDHSPVRVAYSMVMKGLGIPRIYLQHAEVTSLFPPLDFEYSILRNAHSKSIYESLGPASGQVFVLPRYREPFAAEDLGKELVAPVTVAIYPTSRVVVEGLKAVIKSLRSNAGVGKIVIKQHPAAARQLQDVLDGMSVEFAPAIPDERHLALVGNSAVVTELLHLGIPVYQNFTFDPVSPDYYGFVAKGLTQSVTVENLAGEFWRPYRLDAAWRAAFKQLDPSVDTAYETERDQFLAEMQRLRAAVVPAGRGGRMRGSFKARLKAETKRGLIGLINASPAISAPVLDFALSGASKLGNFLTLYSYLGANYLRNRTNIPVKSGRWGADKTPGQSRTDPASALPLVEATLGNLRDPAAWIAENQRLGVFGDDLVIRALENMFQDRRPELGDVFAGFSAWPEGSTVGTWVYLKRAEWGNIALDVAELDRIGVYVHGLGAEKVAKPLLERLLLLALIRNGTTSQLDAFWGRAATTTIETIGTNVRIGLLQKLYDDQRSMAQAVATRQRIEATSSPFELLKLRNMDYLSGRASPGWTHERAEELFGKLAPGGAAREFREIAVPFYDRFRSNMVLMEIRTDRLQVTSALDHIRQCLNEGKPFSFVRLSDGEGYLFPGHPHFSADDSRNRERHWWDTELPRDLSARIIERAQKAIAAADILGIPSVYRFIRDTSDTTRALSQSLQGRGLLQVLAGLPPLLSKDVRLSEDKMNVSLFSDLQTVLDLASNARRAFLVGSVKREHLPAPLSALATLSTVTIPTHARTASNERYIPNTTALPFVYETILGALDDVGPGDLVLVAGGIVGKIMLGHASMRGAVALDIGSVIDDWVSGGQKSLR